MEVMKQCDEEALDFAENKLMENINKNDTTSLIFYLKCKGKHRGYVEKQSLEIAGTDGGAVKIDNQIKPDFTKLSDEELRSYVEICEKLSGVDGRPES
jgi:hypothetical protein